MTHETLNNKFRELDTHLCNAHIVADEVATEIKDPEVRRVFQRNVRRRIELIMTHAIKARLRITS